MLVRLTLFCAALLSGFDSIQSAKLPSQGSRDLTEDIVAATELVNRVYQEAEALMPLIGNFQQILFGDSRPYMRDITIRMRLLGIEEAKILEFQSLRAIYMTEIRSIVPALISPIGPAFLGPSSKTMYDLSNNLSAPVLTADVAALTDGSSNYNKQFAGDVPEVGRRLEELFITNLLILSGTTGPERDEINADRRTIKSMNTAYRALVVAHMDALYATTLEAIEAVNVVISQLPPEGHSKN